jgi:predicted ATPase
MVSFRWEEYPMIESIESIHFENFKALRDSTLPLGPCNVLVGPNGCGKSTVLQALGILREYAERALRQGQSNFGGYSGAPQTPQYSELLSAARRGDGTAAVKLNVMFSGLPGRAELDFAPNALGPTGPHYVRTERPEPSEHVNNELAGIAVYNLDPSKIALPVALKRDITIDPNGGNLAGVLDGLRDREPERFEAITEELARWLPEFDRILFDTDDSGKRLIALRTREGRHEIAAASLSQGTLIALTLLTLAYLRQPPTLIGLEEPDRGLHPWLLRRVQDAIYRLAYPKDCGESRPPVQVIATTHSPYFLDLFKDNPEEIIVANKVDDNVQFERLSERPHAREILGDAPVGEIWCSGILGGVPTEP